jgi:WD40 repeat protein
MSMTFSPDGQSLVWCGYDRTIRVMDVQSGKERSWDEDERVNLIRRLAFLPDGRTLITVANQVSAWDFETGKRLFGTGCIDISGLAVGADAGFLAAGLWRSGMVATFDRASGKPLTAWQAQDCDIENLAMSRAGDMLVTVGEDGVARAWDPARQQLRAKWAAHASRIWSIAMSPDGRTLVTGANDGLVKIWDVSALTACPTAAPPQPLLVMPIRKRFQGHTGSVLTVAFSADGKTLASGGHDRAIRLWDVATGHAGPELRGHECEIQEVAFSSDRTTLASCGGNADKGEVFLWDYRDGTQLATLPGNTRTVMDIAFSSDGRLLASCGFDRMVRVYNVADRQEVAAFDGKQPIFSRRIAFTRDNQALATCGDVLMRYEWAKGTPRVEAPHQEASDMKFSVKEDMVAVSTWQTGKITLYDFKTLKPTVTWQAHRVSAEALAVSPDGRFLASTSADGTAKIWDLADQRLRAVLLGHRGFVYAVAFSPDGRTLATTGYAQEFDVLLWDVSALNGEHAR